MERRKVLAAISAAIATPALAWTKYEGHDGSTGLTEAQFAVREALAEQLRAGLERLIDEPGAGPLVDMWALSLAFEYYNLADVSGSHCGLVTALLDVFGRDERFVSVPEEIHEEVQAFISRRRNALAAAEA
jgi:hypothetical protein